MASSTEFADFVVESLQPLGPVVARRMFGGFGIYLDGVMFALIAYDTLYFKVDDGNRPAYEDAGLPHFVYTDKGKPIRMPYREAGRGLRRPRDPVRLGERGLRRRPADQEAQAPLSRARHLVRLATRSVVHFSGDLPVLG